MPDATQSYARDLGDYGALLRRRWMWVVLGLLIGLVAGAAYLQVKTPTYVATAKVKVESTVADTTQDITRTDGAVNLDTEAQFVTSSPVASSVADTLNTDASPTGLARRVTVTVPPNTTVLSISFEASTAEAAQAGAQAFAEAYLANRADIANGLIKAESARLQDQIDAISSRMQRNIRILNDSSRTLTDSQRALLQSSTSQDRAQLNRLQKALDPLVDSIVRPGTVIVEAQRPTSPQSPNTLLVLASAVMAGLLIGLGLATLRDRLDKRLHSAAEVEKAFGLAVLGDLDLRKRDLSDVQPDSVQARQLRALALAVQAAVPVESPTALVIAVSDGASARDITREMALAAASSGARAGLLTRKATVKVDAPIIRRREGEGDVRLVSYEQLKLAGTPGVTAGDVPEALDRVREGRDFVVLDPLTGEPTVDLPMLARYVDVVVVVIDVARTTRARLGSFLTLTHRSGAPAICAVTVRRRRRGGSKPARDDIQALREQKSKSAKPEADKDADQDSPTPSEPVIPG